MNAAYEMHAIMLVQPTMVVINADNQYIRLGNAMPNMSVTMLSAACKWVPQWTHLTLYICVYMQFGCIFWIHTFYLCLRINILTLDTCCCLYWITQLKYPLQDNYRSVIFLTITFFYFSMNFQISFCMMSRTYLSLKMYRFRVVLIERLEEN